MPQPQPRSRVTRQSDRELSRGAEETQRRAGHRLDRDWKSLLIDGEARMVVREASGASGTDEEEAAGCGTEIGGKVFAGHERLEVDESVWIGGLAHE